MELDHENQVDYELFNLSLAPGESGAVESHVEVQDICGFGWYTDWANVWLVLTNEWQGSQVPASR